MRRVVLLICLTGCRFGFDERTAGDGGGDSTDVGVGPDVAFGNCWSAWLTGPLQLSTPQPVTTLNTSVLEGDPFLSADALSLYYSQAGDLFVATRPDRFSPFANATPVSELNTAGDETKLTLTSDGSTAIWSTNRAGSAGYDLWEAVRATPAGAFGTPSSAAFAQVNDNANQFDPHLSTDGLRLYLAPQSAPNQFIQVAERATVPGNFSSVVGVGDLAANRTADPALSPDELVIVYSARQSASDVLTIWYATRPSLAAPFANGQRIASLSDGTVYDQDPVLSFDGCELYFSRHLGTAIDLYVSVVQ